MAKTAQDKPCSFLIQPPFVDANVSFLATTSFILVSSTDLILGTELEISSQIHLFGGNI